MSSNNSLPISQTKNVSYLSPSVYFHEKNDQITGDIPLGFSLQTDQSVFNEKHTSLLPQKALLRRDAVIDKLSNEREQLELLREALLVQRSGVQKLLEEAKQLINSLKKMKNGLNKNDTEGFIKTLEIKLQILELTVPSVLSHREIELQESSTKIKELIEQLTI